MATNDSPLSTPNKTLQAILRPGFTIGDPQEPDLTLPAGNIVSDDFSSGDLESPGYDTFDWGGSANQRFTSLVTMDDATGDPTVIFTTTGSSTYNVLTDDPRDWTALHGANALRFAFNKGTDTNVFAEQRWTLVGRAERTLWLRMAMRVPTNYVHENVPDTFGESRSSASNNKLLAIWMDAYSSSGDGSTLILELYESGNGNSNLQVKVSPGRFSVVNSVGSSVRFITVPEDRGRYMYLALKVVAESTEDANDGSVEVWRKWAGEDDWAKLHDHSGIRVRVPTAGPNGFENGYLLGADNSGYMEDTEFLVDDFNLSTESLL